MTDYLNTIEVIAIHDYLLEKYGGSPGIRDLGLIEAALYRPQTGYYSDVIQEAAALWESLSQNHPFVDGNKRVSFACTDVFLNMNGFRLDVSSDEAYAFTMMLHETSNFKFSELEIWLREHVSTKS